MSVDLAQFIPVFLEESYEGLQVMETALLTLTPGDDETIDEVFRAAHSIKGGAGTFGFTAVAEFTHEAETLLDAMRNGSVEVTPERNQLLLKSADIIRDLLERAAAGDQSTPPEADALAEQLHLAHASPAQSPAPAVNDTDVPAAEDSTDGIWTIRLEPGPDLLMTGNDPLFLLQALAELGPVSTQADAASLPEWSALDPEALYLNWTIELHSDCDEAAIREVFEWVEDDVVLTIERQETASAAGDNSDEAATSEAIPAPDPDAKPAITDTGPAQPEGPQNRARSAVRESSIRVDTGKVDSLVDRVGELVITQAMLLEVSQALAELEHPAVEALQEGLLQLERNTRELQEDVMRIRMLPISSVFNRFPRLVHDVSQQLGKQVELHLEGAHTELDKTVLEKIGDPLVHLVRNGLDHGLEPPEEREAAGKSASGNIWLSACQQGGNILIEIRDDGRGLNRERILAKAMERGLVEPAAQLTDQAIDELIFMPGFSTAEQVSDLSGRGVGMDVVRRNIESLGGHIDVLSSPGTGSCFTIRLPLTLAIMDGQLVRLNQDPYVIPLISIVETLQTTPEMLVSLAGNRCLLHFRDEYLPLIKLSSSFGLTSEQVLEPGGIVVVVESGGQKAGLVVDELMGQQQTVIKSLEKNYRRVPGLSGATILGDGSVALILDIAGLISRNVDPDAALIARQRNEQHEVQA